MKMTTIEIYNALIEAGIDKEKAKKASEVIVTKDMAAEFATKEDTFALKSDIARLESKINMLTGFMFAINGAILVAVLFG